MQFKQMKLINRKMSIANSNFFISDNPIIRSRIVDVNARYMGASQAKMMDLAGKGMAKVLKERYGVSAKYTFLCGGGGNGGDGFSAAYELCKLGVKNVVVLITVQRSQIDTKVVREFLDRLLESSYVRGHQVEVKYSALATDLVESDVVVECLIGTGYSGRLKTSYLQLIRKAQKINSKLVAADLPCGNYKYDLVISFGFAKTKDALVVDIGLEKEYEKYCGMGEAKIMAEPELKSNKTQNGELLVFGGSRQFHGAPLMSIKTASKLIGSVFYYTNPENREIANQIKLNLEEFILLDDNGLAKYAEYANAFLFGPGLEPNIPTLAIIKTLCELYPEKPTILDAYAMSVGREFGILKNKILTPHRGELRHLFGKNSGYLKWSQLETEKKLIKFCRTYGCYILLKGKVDLLVHPKGYVAYNRTGNQGMAKGGTGDVLAGMLGAFVTKNDQWLSMRAAAFLCGSAGDICYTKSRFAYSASDLIATIPEAIKQAKEY